MRAVRSFPLLLSLLLPAAACARSSDPGSPQPAAQARVSVENRSSIDMDVYVRRQDDQTSRLGFVPANQTTLFPLPPGLIAGAGIVRFEARPVRGSGQPVFSDQFNIGPGAELSWSIPPQ